MKKIIFIFTAALMIIGCATVSHIQPKQDDLSQMQQKVPGISLEEAQKGFKLYKYNCAGCHNLHKPETYDKTGWEKVLPEMISRAKLAEKDAGLIRNYLFAKSK